MSSIPRPDDVRRYSDELRRLYAKGDHAPPAPVPASSPAPAPAAAPAPDPRVIDAPTETAIPTVPTDGNLPAAPPFGDEQAGTAQTSDTAPADEEADVGFLVVRLTSARGTIPIVGATVTVYRADEDGDRLFYIGQTDENGESPVWSLPTKRRELSLEPGNAAPFTDYVVQANAAGYAVFFSEGVSIFGGVQTIQRLPMQPLPDSADATTATRFVTRSKAPLPELY